MKTQYYLFLLCYCMQLPMLFSQTAPKEIGHMTTQLKQAAISPSQITAITALMTKRSEALAAYQEELEERKRMGSFHFSHEDVNEVSIHRSFKKALTAVLTLAEYQRVITPQLNPRITRITAKKWDTLAAMHPFTAAQKTALQAQLFRNTQEEETLKEYYAYDMDKAWNTYIARKQELDHALQQQLKEYGYSMALDSATQDFVQKAEAAGVDANRIQKILEALHQRELQYEAMNRSWQTNSNKYVIYLQDKQMQMTGHQIRMELRKKLNKILSYEEFKSIFIQQITPWVTRKLQNELATVPKERFDGERYQQLEALLQDKFTEIILTEQYYKHNWNLSQQKVKAVAYRYEKKYRELLRASITN